MFKILIVKNIPLILSGVFYCGLCIFSLVVGLIHMTGDRKLDTRELSEKTLKKLSDPEKMKAFARKMGWVTFIVGIVQGVTGYCILRGGSPVCYWIPFAFDAFSIFSAGMKLKSKIDWFPLCKIIAYTAILMVMLLPASRALYF